MTTFDLGLRPSAPVTTPATAAVELPSTRGGLLDWLRLVAAVLARTVLFSVLGLALWGALPLAIGWHPTTVMTGSMEPRVHVGDVVVAAPVAEADLHRGQVLLFADPDQAGHLRLHRYDSDAAGGLLVTKGDANPQADSTPVDRSAVEGVAVLRVPFVGLPVTWAREGRVGHLLVAGGLLVLTVVLSRADAGLRARLRDDERPEARVDPDGDLAPVTPRGERRAARRRERRARRLRTLGAGAAFALLSGSLAVTLVVSDGAHAAYAAPTTNPTSSYAASSTYDCLSDSYNAQTSFGFSYNETSGTTTTDGSSFRRVGTLAGGASFVPGSCATNGSPYLQLDGTGSVSTAVQLGGQPAFTVETWFRTTSTTGGALMAFAPAATGTSTSDRALYMTNAGTLVLGVRPTTSTVRGTTTPRAYADGQWHHVVATFSGSGTSFYVDGALLGTDTANATAQTAAGYWRIGSATLTGLPSAPSSQGFVGSIDGTTIYNNSAQTAAQVRARYDVGR